MIQFIKNNFSTILLRLIQIATIIITLLYDLILGFVLLIYAIYLNIDWFFRKNKQRRKEGDNNGESKDN